MKSDPWLQTYSGKAFYPFRPTTDGIDIESLANALGNICRFSGHCKGFYSVATHSVYVAKAVEKLCPTNIDLCIAALMHDAHEAYSGFGDINGPMKRALPIEIKQAIDDVEYEIDKKIAERFEFAQELMYDPIVHQMDRYILAGEARDIMGEAPKEWMQMPEPPIYSIVFETPWAAAESFMRVFAEYNEVRYGS